mmetsp:Transcript_20749/g.67201  ORF Transcript_20749/g.67201 Transcript_20749/m.67201 type:complete len:273 (+) Transcript_20749:207-1025(+)
MYTYIVLITHGNNALSFPVALWARVAFESFARACEGARGGELGPDDVRVVVVGARVRAPARRGRVELLRQPPLVRAAREHARGALLRHASLLARGEACLELSRWVRSDAEAGGLGRGDFEVRGREVELPGDGAREALSRGEAGVVLAPLPRLVHRERERGTPSRGDRPSVEDAVPAPCGERHRLGRPRDVRHRPPRLESSHAGFGGRLVDPARKIEQLVVGVVRLVLLLLLLLLRRPRRSFFTLLRLDAPEELVQHRLRHAPAALPAPRLPG